MIFHDGLLFQQAQDKIKSHLDSLRVELFSDVAKFNKVCPRIICITWHNSNVIVTIYSLSVLI